MSECLESLLRLNHIQMVGSDGCLFKIRNAYALGKWGGCYFCRNACNSPTEYPVSKQIKSNFIFFYYIHFFKSIYFI